MQLHKFFTILATATLINVVDAAHAEVTLFGGRPQIGIEFEREKAADGLSRSDAMTLFPGIVWEDGWITRAELLLMREREVDSSGGTSERSYEYAYGLRLRKDVHFTDNFGGFLRTLIGRKGDKDISYNYGYIEPALTLDLNESIEMYTGYRFIRSLDQQLGQDADQLRLGPGWDIDEHHGVDLRWSRTWNSQTRARLSDAVEVEYSYRF
jgi:hypothetical protein